MASGVVHFSAHLTSQGSHRVSCWILALLPVCTTYWTSVGQSPHYVYPPDITLYPNPLGLPQPTLGNGTVPWLGRTKQDCFTNDKTTDLESEKSISKS